MEASIINKNSLSRELINKYGTRHSYLKVCSAIDGTARNLSESDAKEMCEFLDHYIKEVKTNIKQCVTK